MPTFSSTLPTEMVRLSSLLSIVPLISPSLSDRFSNRAASANIWAIIALSTSLIVPFKVSVFEITAFSTFPTEPDMLSEQLLIASFMDCSELLTALQTASFELSIASLVLSTDSFVLLIASLTSDNFDNDVSDLVSMPSSLLSNKAFISLELLLNMETLSAIACDILFWDSMNFEREFIKSFWESVNFSRRLDISSNFSSEDFSIFDID